MTSYFKIPNNNITDNSNKVFYILCDVLEFNKRAELLTPERHDSGVSNSSKDDPHAGLHYAKPLQRKWLNYKQISRACVLLKYVDPCKKEKWTGYTQLHELKAGLITR